MYCVNCGNKLRVNGNGKCSKCKVQVPEKMQEIAKKDVSELDDFEDIGGNIYFCVLFYFGPLVLLGINKRDSEFCVFHFKQGLFTFLLFVAGIISLFAFKTMVIIAVGFFLAEAILSVIGIMNVVNGEKKPLPLVGEYILKLIK